MYAGVSAGMEMWMEMEMEKGDGDGYEAGGRGGRPVSRS